MEFKTLKSPFFLSSCSITIILKNIIISYFITLILFFLFSFVITYSSISLNLVSAITVIITNVSIIIAGIINGKNSTEKGWLTGIITGFIYMFLIYVVGCIFTKNFHISVNGIIMIISGLFSGALGSIIGINNKKR